MSKEVAFKDAVKALNLSTFEVIEIENLKTTDEQRVFEVLDCWRRRGSRGQRGLSELYQLLALVGGKIHLVDDIMRMTDGKSHLKLFR